MFETIDNEVFELIKASFSKKDWHTDPYIQKNVGKIKCMKNVVLEMTLDMVESRWILHWGEYHGAASEAQSRDMDYLYEVLLKKEIDKKTALLIHKLKDYNRGEI